MTDVRRAPSERVVGLVRAMRPHQWVKNLFVLTPLVFAKELFEPHATLRAFAGFFLFCLLASAVYLLNDLADVDADRAHPVKRHRPIASGVVPASLAKVAIGILLVTALGAGLALHPLFAGCAFAYIALNLAYSVRLKRVAYVDVLCIATGFELRVLGGGYAAAVPTSMYLLLVTFLLASFLGFGKRMHELAQSNGSSGQSRSVLRAYDKRTLTWLLFVTAAATLSTYVIYTLDRHTRQFFGTDYLAGTTLFALFGVFRFIHLVRGRPHAESPTEEMLRDVPFLSNLALWAITVVVVIYVT